MTSLFHSLKASYRGESAKGPPLLTRSVEQHSTATPGYPIRSFHFWVLKSIPSSLPWFLQAADRLCTKLIDSCTNQTHSLAYLQQGFSAERCGKLQINSEFVLAFQSYRWLNLDFDFDLPIQSPNWLHLGVHREILIRGPSGLNRSPPYSKCFSNSKRLWSIELQE